MALINCPECGKEISDKAANCPNCGCPIAEKNEQQNQQFPQEQPVVIKPYTKNDKIAGQTSRLVIGIISCCLFFVIMLQSCAVGVSNALVNEGESSGTFGFLLSITMLISGILCIVMRKKESKISYILPICFYTFGSLLSAVGGGSYSDLFVWCSLGILFASIILFNFFNGMESKTAILAIVVPIVFFIVMTGAVNSLKPPKKTTQETVKEISESANMEKNSESNTASTSNTATTENEDPQPISKENFIASCQEIPYKTLARNPDDHIGEHIVLTVKVSQIVQGGMFDDGQYYRVYTNDEYDMWLGDEYFMYDSRKNDNTKILQDDILTVYAEFAGVETIERALTGAKEDVLSIKAVYIELIDDYEQDSSDINDTNTTTTDEKDTTDDDLTTGQRNALSSAKNYLSFQSFSYQGLIDQLEYDQYSHDDAVFAADNCGADWNEQAASAAKNYLDFMSFSKDGLIDQLEYDGFTNEQAVYGAEANGY